MWDMTPASATPTSAHPDTGELRATSPDGRYEIVVERHADRWEYVYTTTLHDRTTNERLFESNLPASGAAFEPDGTLALQGPHHPHASVLIDPAARAFRLDAHDPWVPLSAWPAVQAAYARGWSAGVQFRLTDHPPTFPWVTFGLLVGCLIALPLLMLLPPLRRNQLFDLRIPLVLIAGAGVLLFGWLTGDAVRGWWVERGSIPKR